MSKSEEGSVAPTERVNIVYRPAMEGAKEDVELPLKLLVTGDFTGQPDARPVDQREPTAVNKDNFNDVLKAHHVGLHLGVSDKLSGTSEGELDVSLAFESMDDFGPERIAAQVPELKTLVEMRDALTALKGPLANVPEFRNRLQVLVKDEHARARILKEMGIDVPEEAHRD
jgi:type VI secretion system protein ImpB